MAHSLAFPVASPTPRRVHRAKRSTASKFQEIALRSPKDMQAFDVLADMVLAQLDEDEDRRVARKH